MTDLVLLHHNEPMTTSLAIADGVKMAHASVIKLVRKYVEDLQKFGPLGFEIHVVKRKQGGGDPAEVAYLNEGQSIFLLTLMRNSEIVVRFKVALVQAFLELRDRLAVPPAPTFLTGNPSHGADLVVSADRTFRSFMRASRAAGLRLPAALRTANRQTLARTGMDMLAELGVDPGEVTVGDPIIDPGAVGAFSREWLDGQLPIPATVCRGSDLFRAYLLWCQRADIRPAPVNRFAPLLRELRPEVSSRHLDAWVGGRAMRTRCCIVGFPPRGAAAVTTEIDRFAVALADWLTQSMEAT